MGGGAGDAKEAQLEVAQAASGGAVGQRLEEDIARVQMRVGQPEAAEGGKAFQDLTAQS